MKKSLGYILLLILLLTMSPGPETLRTLTFNDQDISHAWLIFIPSAFFYLLATLVVNDLLLIPKLLLKNKFAQYLTFAYILAFTASFLASLTESTIKDLYNLPYKSPTHSISWILDDSFANAFFLLMVFISLALLRLYDKWNSDMVEERQMSENLEKYIANVRDCLNPKAIFSELRKISSTIYQNKEKATEMIDKLSSYLRQQLTELPTPPVLSEPKYDKSLFSGFTSFLVSRRFGFLRYSIFILILAFVSLTAYSQEQALSPLESTVQAVTLFVFLVIISSIVILWLFRRYENNQDLRRYFRSIMVFLAIILSPIIFSIVLLFIKHSEIRLLPLIMETATRCAGIIAIVMYVIGLSALLFFQNWIRVQRHITLIQNETLRQEYLFLRKQINPHFIFNVLNNIEICVYDEPYIASELIQNLISILEYQFADSKREMTTIKDEVDFLDSYLSLEQSRRDNFVYKIDTEEDAKDIRIPTLLLIPIIENAVKYSYYGSENIQNVEVSFKVDGKWLKFECRNPYNKDKVSEMSHHGIGLENTRRRLELLYDGKAKISTYKSAGIYDIELFIPFK